jgi:hypothetical protein
MIMGIQVEMFKIRMQGQYGGPGDKKLGAVVGGMWKDWGFRNGIMRGYWVCHSSSITYPITPHSSSLSTSCTLRTLLV